MNSTSESLLLRLRDGYQQQVNQAAWTEFAKLYTPLIFSWAKKMGLETNDASDLTQDVLTRVFQKLPHFEYDAKLRFRSWLKTVTINRYRETVRRKSAEQIVASHSVLEKYQQVDQAESTWDIDYARLLIQQAMSTMKSDFAEGTWEALTLVFGQQVSVDAAAEKTGVSAWTIYSARSRLLKRLRVELDGLL